LARSVFLGIGAAVRSSRKIALGTLRIWRLAQILDAGDVFHLCYRPFLLSPAFACSSSMLGAPAKKKKPLHGNRGALRRDVAMTGPRSKAPKTINIKTPKKAPA